MSGLFLSLPTACQRGLPVIYLRGAWLVGANSSCCGSERVNRGIQTDAGENFEKHFHFTADYYLRKLSQESYERQEREQRLSAADEKVVSVAEEVKAYKWVRLPKRESAAQEAVVGFVI